MKSDKRYRLAQVFWSVMAIYFSFGLLGLIALAISFELKITLTKEFDWALLFNHGSSVLFTTFFYYFSLNFFYQLFANRAALKTFLKPVGVAILVIYLYNFFNYYAFRENSFGISISVDNQPKAFPLFLILFSYLLNAAIYIIISMLIAYLTYLRDERQQRKVLEAQKMQLEIEKSQANFKFLKAQINPHFLHNTLNFLYAKSLPYSSELSEGILTLSDMMRYALNEGNAKDGKVLLNDEIEHVNNLVKINQLRFNDKLNVELMMEGRVDGAKIIPFILITLVENAFKHGDLKSREQPIVIRIRVDAAGLYFYCKNKKKSGLKELSTGIGLDNIKKRLSLAYGTGYQLQIQDEVYFYTTELTIGTL